MKFISVLCIYGYQPPENVMESHREAARRWAANLLYIYQASWMGIHYHTDKLRLNQRFPDGSQVIAIDGDVIIRHDCPNLFDIVGDKFGAVRHHATCRNWARPQGRIDPFTDRAGVPRLDERKDYVQGGMYAFSVPNHNHIFERARSLDDAQGNPSKDSWDISEQLPMSLAMREHPEDVMWLPTTFNRCQMWDKRHTEMEHFIEHYCGLENRNTVLQSVNWKHSLNQWHCAQCGVRRFQGKPNAFFGDELQYLIRELCKLPLDCKMVEVGTHVGGTTWYAGRHVQSIDGEYWCVDPWDFGWYYPSADERYDSFLKNMHDSGLDGFVTPLRMKSVEAAKQFADGSLDCVFLDGDHEYESVKSDILAWWPKLKATGVMLGHDYGNPSFPGLNKAVHECFGDRVEVSQNNDVENHIWKATGPLVFSAGGAERIGRMVGETWNIQGYEWYGPAREPEEIIIMGQPSGSCQTLRIDASNPGEFEGEQDAAD